MSEIYKKIGNYNLLAENNRFGLKNSVGELLLPCEYDSIFLENGGFIITKNSKSGYVKFCDKKTRHKKYEDVNAFPERIAKVFLPCIYDRIEPTRNGLVLHSMTSEAFSTKREWYDYRENKIYKNLHFTRNYGDYDKFLDKEKPDDNSILKKAGEERYIGFPPNVSAEILFEVALYNSAVRYFVCCEELSDEASERKGHICEYFLLVVLPYTYTFTEQKSDIISVFDDFPNIVRFWNEEAKKETEQKDYLKGRKKNDKHFKKEEI